MAPTPKVNPTNNSSVAQAANNRLNSLIPSLASQDSPSTVWLPSLTIQLQAAETPPTNTYGTNSSGTWTCPAGITSVQVEIWGGGGGGGGGGLSAQGGGGGGGGGEYVCEPSYPVVPGEQYSYTCGDGGVGGVTGYPGANGVKTVFDLQGVGIAGGMTANGGTGGDQTSLGKGGAGGTGNTTNTIHQPGGAGGTNANGIGDDVPWNDPDIMLDLVYWFKMDDDPSTSNTIMDSGLGLIATPNNINTPASNTFPNTPGGSNPNSVVLGNTSPIAPPQVPTANLTPALSPLGFGELFQANAFWDWTAPSSTEMPYYRLNNATTSTTGITISFWAYADAGGNFNGTNLSPGTVVETFDYTAGTINAPGYAIWFDTSNSLNFKISRPAGGGLYAASTLNCTTAASTSSWNYCVCSYDGGVANTMRLWMYNASHPSGITASVAGPSGVGNAVQFSSNRTFIGVNVKTSSVNNGFSGYLSNLWMAVKPTPGASTWPGLTYNGSGTPSTTGCGGGSSGGGGGAGEIGGTGGSGGNGAPAPSVPSGSTLTIGGVGTAGGLLDSDGTAPASNTYGGGGGGAGGIDTSAPVLTTLTMVASQSASYAGPDSVDNPSAMYTYSLAPLVTNSDEKQFTSNANLSPDCYQGGQQQIDGNYEGTMSSAVLIPNTAAVTKKLTGQALYSLTLSAEILSPNAASLLLGYTSDTSLGTTFTASSVTSVTSLPVPAGAQNTVVTWDLTSHTTFAGAIVSGAATCLILGPGSTPGSASYSNTATAQQFSVALIGAGGVASGYLQDLTLTMKYAASGYTQGAQGAPGYIRITSIDPTGTPVASMQPVATTDSQGNAYAAGFTGPISTWDPVAGQGTIETWHKPVTLSNGWVQSSPGFQYRLRSDNTVSLAGLIDSTSMTNATFYTLPSAYRPAQQLDFPIAFHNASIPTNVFGRVHTDGTITIINAATSTGTISMSITIPLDLNA